MCNTHNKNMADNEEEIIEQQEELEDAGDLQPEVEAPPIPEQPPVNMVSIDASELNALRSEQGRLKKVSDALRLKGAAYDPSSDELVQLAGFQQPAQPQYQTPTEPEAEEEFDPYDKEKRDRDIERAAARIVDERFSRMIPVIDATVQLGIASEVPDWKDIQSGVLTSAKEFGFNNLVELKANPQAFELILNAERGKRAMLNPASIPSNTSSVNTEEAASRAAMANKAAGIGSGSVANAVAPSSTDWSADERKYMTDNKLTEAQYLQMISGAVSVKKKAGS